MTKYSCIKPDAQISVRHKAILDHAVFDLSLKREGCKLFFDNALLSKMEKNAIHREKVV